ncbi:MAG: molybdate ABC transporter substrate-binding protein [Clostridium sp.]|nr:molybdate ABC transporter substrate-binding protein [Clostridium sp.]
MIKRFKFIPTLCCLSLLLTGCSSSNSEKDNSIELNISAAASLKEAMTDLENAYNFKNDNVNFVINYGSSGSLQQQIEHGAPCDLFISAGQKQMDNLEDKGLLLDGTNKDLIKNSLVLITSKDSQITSIDNLTSDTVSKIALGEPSSVPAGKYADETLTSLDIKDSLNNKFVFAKDVKEVLAWTTSGNVDAGFVYLSDALNNDKVNIVETIAEEYHSPITYPVAVIKNSKKTDIAKAFEDFLFTKEAQDIFEKYGYKSIE